MKPSQVSKALDSLIAIKQPTMIWGPPGAGKSNVVAQASQRYGGGFIDLRLPLLDSVDLRGIPAIIDGKTVWLTPAFFPMAGHGVLFLDELPQAMPIVQSAASQLILDRKIGEYTLPDGWAVIAAGNRDGDRAATNRMPSHIANRFTHLNFEVDSNDWCDWADSNGVHPMITAFIQFRPELLHKFDPQQKAFSTPRSWGFVSKILDAGTVDECLHEVVAGTVGEGAAIEFSAFIRVFRELPDYADIIKRPGGINVSSEAAALYAVSNMMAAFAEAKDMKALMTYVERLPEEFQICTVTAMTRRAKKDQDARRLFETSAYIGWAAKHKDVLLNSTIR